MNESVNHEEGNQNEVFSVDEVTSWDETNAASTLGGDVMESESVQIAPREENFDPEMFNPNEASTDAGGVLDDNPVAQKMFFVIIGVAIFLFLLGLTVFIMGSL